MAPWPEQGTDTKIAEKDKCETTENSSKSEVEENSNRSEQKQTEEKEVLNLDECQLKSLLEEAVTYKNPKDRETKSVLFNNLLQRAEADEHKKQDFAESLTSKLPRGYYNLQKRRHSRNHARGECGVGVSTTRGGSLQNLHALGMEGGRRRGRSGRTGEPQPGSLVSARQREGGSLPTNVNVDDTDIEMYPHNYTSRATLEVSATGSNNEEPVESSSLPSAPQGVLPNGTEATPSNNVVLQHVDGAYSTAVVPRQPQQDEFASSMCVGPVESGAMLYSSAPVQHVSVLSIPPSQIHVPQEESVELRKASNNRSGASTGNQLKKLVLHAPLPLDAPHHGSEMGPVIIQPPDDEVELTSEALLGIPLSAHWNRYYSSFTLLNFSDTRLMPIKDPSDPKNKPVDENGNALSVLRMDSNCLDKKKKKKVKSKNAKNETELKISEIQGFKGDKDIDALVEYIDSPSLPTLENKRSNQSNGTRSNVKVLSKEYDSSRHMKKNSRTKEKFHRCNSLEEVSKTKLEDLTEESSSERVNGSSHALAKKQLTLDDAQLRKSSWDNVSASSEAIRVDQKLENHSSCDIQDADFHLVTKKQRKKKRRGGIGRGGSKPTYLEGQGFPAHDRTLERDGGLSLYTRGNKSCSQSRRKSASSVPPSDKSDSSDLDSVHSLPVSSTQTKATVGKNSVSGGSTPQTSYADIARPMASPSDISSVGASLSDTSPLLPSTFASSFKRDATTITVTESTCDTALPNEEYPPLATRNINMNAPAKKQSASKEPGMCSETNVTHNIVIPLESGDVSLSIPVVPSTCVKSNVNINISNKRPPVILMGEAGATQPASELTFGFEVNEQLLKCEETLCNFQNNKITSASFLVASTCAVPPMSPEEEASLKRLVEHHVACWEEAMKLLREGKVKYYDGQ